MVAHVDIRFSFPEIFASVEFIPDKSQLAENPAPQIEKEISNTACTNTEKKRDDDTGKKPNHEYRKHDTYPDNV